MSEMNEQVESLIQALKEKDWHVRSEAVDALGEIGDKRAVEPLIQVLKDENEDVRWRAAWALGKIGDKRAVEPLIQALMDKDEVVRKGVAWALRKMGWIMGWRATKALEKIGWRPKDDVERAYYLIAKSEWEELIKLGTPAVEPLIQALKDEDWNIRTGAAEALGKIGDKGAVEPLIQALNDKDSHVRKGVAWALGDVGDERAVEPLIQAMNDKGSDIRVGSAWALGKIGDKRAVEPLIKAALKDKYWYVRNKAAEALGKIGWRPKDDVERAYYLIAKSEWEELIKLGTPAVEPLIQALKDEDSRVRSEAAWALGEIGDKRTVESLIQALKDEDEIVRRSATEALGKIGDKRAVEPLIQALNSYYEIVRGIAVEALGKIGDKRAVEPLIQALNYENESVRKRAAWALGEIGERAVEILIQDLKNEDKDVRKEAAEVLGKIREMAVEPLTQALMDEDESVREEAEKALGKIREEVVEPFIKTLNDKEKLPYIAPEQSIIEIQRKCSVEYYNPMEVNHEYLLKIGLLLTKKEESFIKGINVMWGDVKFETEEPEPEVEVVPQSTFFIFAPAKRALTIKANQDVFTDFKIQPTQLPDTPKTDIKIEFLYKNKPVGKINIDVEIQNKFIIIDDIKISHEKWVETIKIASVIGTAGIFLHVFYLLFESFKHAWLFYLGYLLIASSLSSFCFGVYLGINRSRKIGKSFE